MVFLSTYSSKTKTLFFRWMALFIFGDKAPNLSTIGMTRAGRIYGRITSHHTILEIYHFIDGRC